MSQTNSSDTRAKMMEHLITLDNISTKMLNDFQKKNELISSLNKIDTHQHIRMAGGGNKQAMPQKKSLDSNSFSLSSISTVSTSTDGTTTDGTTTSSKAAHRQHIRPESGSATSASASASKSQSQSQSKTLSSKSHSKSHSKSQSKSHSQSLTNPSDSAVISSTSSNDRFHGGTFTKDMIDSEGFDLKCGKAGLKRK